MFEELISLHDDGTLHDVCMCTKLHDQCAVKCIIKLQLSIYS